VPGPGRCWRDLAPGCPALGEARLSEWHRLVATGGKSGSAEALAAELCHGRSPELLLRIQSCWLADGATLRLEDLTAGYAEIPRDVLRGVSLTVEARAKVGVVGTTGCGKSTLLLCLLRILEPRGGRIEISGVDAAGLGLRVLRQTVGLVSQEPTFFSGPLRANLDPFGEYTDEEVWGALRRVQLDEDVRELPEGLLSELRPDAENLSFGQRQLMSIARMVLRQPPLLLLDEATSSIDPRTQEMVQKAMASHFAGSTLIAVAHRLETILGYDMIVVMDEGHVVERGTVEELSAVKESIFAKMRAAKQAW